MLARFITGLFLCGLYLLSSPTWALTPVDVSESSDRLHLFGSMEYLQDPGGKLDLDQVRAAEPQRFKPLTDHNFARGISGDTFWVRTALRNSSALPLEWVLYLRHGITDVAEFWILVDDQVATHGVGGDRTLMSERQVAYRYPAIRHISRPGEVATVYVRIANVYPGMINLYFQLDSLGRFLRNATLEQMRHGLLYGVPLALALSALIGWAISRDRRFSAYAFYALSVVGSWVSLNGQLIEIFVDSPTLCNNLTHIFPSLNIVFSCMFIRDFLHTRELLPKSDRFYQALMWCALGIIALRVAGVYTLVSQLVMLLVVISGATAVTAWMAMRKGVVYARWYLAAQLLYAGVNSVSMLAYLTGFYAPQDAVLYAEIGYFGELMLLSFAQYDRIRILQRDKEKVERSYQHVLETRNQELEAQVAERTRHLEDARLQAESMSRTDELTGLSNRREFFRRAHECDAATGIVMLAGLDLDHFKKINDTYGHPAGDAVLRHLATILRRNTRPVDIVSRLGGEEFAILMQVPDVAAGTDVLERLCRAFEAQPITFEGQTIHHTLSIGYTVLDGSGRRRPLEELMVEADQALYAAKNRGRNTVVPYTASSTSQPDAEAKQSDCYSV